MRRGIATLFAFVAATAALAVSGCSAGTHAEPTASTQTLSLSPASNQVYECLREKGWEPTLTWDGGIEVSSESMAKEQLPLYTADEEECWEPINTAIATMTDAEILEVYAAELATRDCLIERGLDVDTPPSAQTYLDQFADASWTAYGAANIDSVAADDAKWRELNEACPQPGWSLGAK